MCGGCAACWIENYHISTYFRLPIEKSHKYGTFSSIFDIDKKRRGGETGIHAALRWLWEKSCRGSSPLLGTSLRQGSGWHGQLRVLDIKKNFRK